MREEVEEVLDTIESWTGDEESRQEIMAAFPEPRELSSICSRMYDLAGPGTPLGDLALSMWPSNKQQEDQE